MNEDIKNEMIFNFSPEFKRGEYIYMGMGLVGDHRVCISVAYKIDYCMKKANQFIEAAPNVKFTHINKVKVGETEACKRILLD